MDPEHSPGSTSLTGLPADCRGRWESFVEETLTETNRRNTVDLVRKQQLLWHVATAEDAGRQIEEGAAHACLPTLHAHVPVCP